MAQSWKRICEKCRHLNAQEPNQHCYMFRDPPDGPCMQNTAVMDEAKKKGTALGAKDLKGLLGAHELK